jgi:hypothetical protein
METSLYIFHRHHYKRIFIIACYFLNALDFLLNIYFLYILRVTINRLLTYQSLKLINFKKIS